jgi:hypothetical protein
MATDQQRSAALGVLAELVPVEVMRRARDIARDIERDEVVRAHLAKRAPAIVFLGLAAMLAATMMVGYLLSYLFRELEPLASWLKVAIGLGGVVLWLACVLGPLHWLLSRLEQEALRAREAEPGAPAWKDSSSA